jgi:hypothetical protein
VTLSDSGGAPEVVSTFNIAGQAYASEQDDYDAGGLSKILLTGAGQAYSLLEKDYSAGVYEGDKATYANVAGQSYYSYEVDKDAGGAMRAMTLDLDNGGHKIVGYQDNLTLTALGDDTMTGGGAGETFVFNANFGADAITDFASHDGAANPDHIALSTSDFADFTALQGAAANVGSNVVIKAGSGDTLTLLGLDTATLAGLEGDFSFHA